MADFDLAHGPTKKFEGGWVNDPDDPGLETFCGWSRRFHPESELWERVDWHKTQPGFPRNAESDPSLQEMLRQEYKKHYWDVFDGDNMMSQDIAEELYDSGVNMGSRRVVRWLQRSINMLNRNQRDYPDIRVDGKFGGETRGALAHLRSKKNTRRLDKLLNGFQLKHYMKRYEEDPVNEKYIGWLDRVEFMVVT